MKTITSIVILFAIYTFPQVYSLSVNGTAGRIVGGSDANAGQFPFAAAVYIQTETSSFFCGGALIDNQHILTAAHCVEGATLFTIRLGSNSLSANDPNRVTVATATYFIHPGFNPNTLENNVAVIRLRLPIQTTSYIQPIALSTTDVPVYDHLTAIGWGQIGDAVPELSDHLQYVSLITITNQECMNIYGFQITDDMACAAGNYQEGTCLGDTGSPLVEHIYIPQGFKLSGIASFMSGQGCDEPHPSGYTRVFLFLDWINSVINS